MKSDHTDALRSLMAAAGIASFRQLSRHAGVSLWQIHQLRNGQIASMRLSGLMLLSQSLHLTLSELVETFSDPPHHAISPAQSQHGRQHTSIASSHDATVAALQHEYDRLHQQIKDQHDQTIDAVIQTALETLESWMVQWPTVAHAAQHNDTIPASRLLPLVRPVENLLETWGIEAIATVGEEVAYDPALHQLMSGTAQPGESVRVRYVGYRRRDTLLHRAKVSPPSL